MPTQYTPRLKIALPTTGELNGAWGDVVNENITAMLDEAISGLAVINSWVANSHTLTVVNGETSESRCAVLVATSDGGGNPNAAATIICPDVSKLYVLKNTSGQQVSLKTAAGTGIAVPNGQTMFLFCDGTNVEECLTNIVNGNIAGNLTVAGNATVNGNTTLGNATTDTVTVTAQIASNLLPSTDDTRDLGSTTREWRDLYIDGTANIDNLLADALTVSGNTTLGDSYLDSTRINGYLSIGGIGSENIGVYSRAVYQAAQVGNFQYGVASTPTGDPATQLLGFLGQATTSNTAATTGTVAQFYAGTVTKGTGSTITNLYGVLVKEQADGANNFGVASEVSSGANKWNIYASGTANNAFAGSVRIGSTVAPTNSLSVTGNVNITGNTTLGDAAGDTLTINGTAVSIPNDLNFDSNTLFIDAANNRVGINTNAPSTALGVVGSARVEAASTQDAVVIAGRAGGTSSFAATLTPTTLSASRTITIPNADITIAGVNTAQTFTAKQTIQVSSATTNAVTQVAQLNSQSTGTPANGIGVGLEFAAETAAGNTEIGATIEAVATDVTAASEDFDLVVKTMAAGVTASEGFRVKNTGGVTIPTGSSYQINGVSVLDATTLGSSVTSSSLTSVGTLTSLTVSGAVTASATTQNIDIGGSQTTGTTSIGGAAQTGTITIAPSTKSHTVNISNANLEAGASRLFRIASSGGDTTANTTIFIGTSAADAPTTSTFIRGATTFSTLKTGQVNTVTVGNGAANTGTTRAIYINSTAQTGNTTATGVETSISANEATLTNIYHFNATQSSFISSSVANQYGYSVADLTATSNVYGFYSGVTSGAGKYGFYSGGGADNYFEGATTFNTTLSVNGSTTLGNAAGDTLTVTSNTVTWSNNPTHSGNHTYSGNLTVNGNTTIGNATGDTLTINATAVSIPNSLNFDSNTLFIDAANNRVGIGTNAPAVNGLHIATGTNGSELRLESSNNTLGTPIAHVNLKRSNNRSAGLSVTDLADAEVAFVGVPHNGGAVTDALVARTAGTERYRITNAGTHFFGNTTTNTNNTLMVVNGEISETTDSVQYKLVNQSDIGTGPNEIPLNQYLGSMAYEDANNVRVGTLVADGNVGIGTTSPGTLLDLGISFGQKLSMYRSGNVRYGFGIETDTLRYYVSTGSSNGVHSFGQISTTDGVTFTERHRIDGSGNQLQTQPAPAAVNATATLTVANLRTRIITSTTAALVTATLPLGTDMDTSLYNAATDMGFDWSVINTGGTNNFVVAGNGGGHTVVGNMTVGPNTSAEFRSRRTAANTWITYRVG